MGGRWVGSRRGKRPGRITVDTAWDRLVILLDIAALQIAKREASARPSLGFHGLGRDSASGLGYFNSEAFVARLERSPSGAVQSPEDRQGDALGNRD